MAIRVVLQREFDQHKRINQIQIDEKLKITFILLIIITRALLCK